MATDPKVQPRPTGASQEANFTMRPIESSDVGTIATWYQQIEDISIFDRKVPMPINQDAVAKVIQSIVDDQEQDKCHWFIAETNAGESVGMTGLEAISTLHGNALLPLFIAEPWRRTGIGIRMACMMIDLGFKQLRLHRISTLYRADNDASASLIERLGFQLEGTSREAWYSQGEYHDLRTVGLLENEWRIVSSELKQELDPAIRMELGPRASERWCWPPRP